jgi:L-Ala-D/L-Glu epimerase
MLREVFRTAIRSTDRVDALAVTLRTADGCSGVGYATATPAITGDTLESMEAFLEQRIRPWCTSIVPSSSGIARARAELCARAAESPSGAAGVDLALADLARQVGGPAELPSVSILTSVTLSAGSAVEMAESARTRIAQGFQTIKCKLGVDPENDIERLAQVDRMRADLNPNVALWVDANQGWTVEETLRFVEDVVAKGIALERLEQPTPAADFDALAIIRARTTTIGLPLVADESAKTISDIDRLADIGAADFINVKVMKFGGLIGSERAIARARTHGLGVLVGSMMEHPESVAAAVRLAAAQSETVHDLDAGWWALDTGPLRYAEGRVYL